MICIIMNETTEENHADNTNSSPTSQKFRTDWRNATVLKRDDFSDIFEKLDQDGEGGIDVFELHTALLATNTIIPLDNLIHLFNSADKDSNASLSVREFRDYLSGYEQLQGLSPARRRMDIWKTLFMDYTFWIVTLYLWPGFLLLTLAFSSGISELHRGNMSLAVTLMYMFPTLHFIISYPFSEWNYQLSIEGKVRIFKESLLSVAKAYLKDNGIDTEKMSDSYIYEIYLDKVMFQKNETDNFLKSDLEIILLSELGDLVSAALIDEVWLSLDSNYDGTLDLNEFHSYLVADVKPPTKIQRTLSILWGMITDKTVLAKLCFFIGGLANFFANVLPRHGYEVDFGLVPAYLLGIGSLYFNFASFDSIRDSYYLQQTVKKIIGSWIETMDECEESAMNMSSAMLVKNFRSNGGLGRNELYRLLETSSIYLPKLAFNNIYDEIDVSKDEKVTRYEIKEYLDRRVDSDIVAILNRCVKSFDFWARTTWLFGSVNYVLAAYDIWKGNSMVSIILFFYYFPSGFLST